MIHRWRDHPWLRRAAFLAANLAAGLAIAGFIVMPAHDFFADRNAAIAEQRALLARFKAIADQEPAVQAIARQTGAEMGRGEFLAGPNEGVVNADLQARLKAMAEATGARLRSVQGLPPKVDDRVRYIGSRIVIYGTIQSIQRAIHAMESGKPYLLVTDAVLKSSQPIARAPGPVVAEEPVVEAQLDIFGAVEVEARGP